MKVYKDKQYLVFELDTGSTVSYDFKEKKAIGKSGAYVKDLRTQLRGLRIRDIVANCTDENYGRFLNFVHRFGGRYGELENIGTILANVPRFSKFEQIFSSGIKSVDSDLKANFSDIPYGLIKICRKHELKLSDLFIKLYKKYPDAVNTAFSLEYTTLTAKNIYDALLAGQNRWQNGTYNYVFYLDIMLSTYGYNTKILMQYIDRLATYEAIDIGYAFMRELNDYCNMMHCISNKFDRQPRNFLTTHAIAARNFNRLRQTFDEEEFAKRIDKSMEWKYKNFIFVYPNKTQDIKDEAVRQNNCVASYIKRVIEGQCHIMFMRHESTPDESLVTIEVRNGKIVQALQHFNEPLTTSQHEAVDAWNKWYEKKIGVVA